MRHELSPVRRYVIESVEDAEQWGNKLWRLTSRASGSICIDAVGRRPKPGDSMFIYYEDQSMNRVVRTEVVPCDS